MNQQKVFEEELRKEGFKEVYTWTDAPNVFYDAHTHESKTAHIIINGQMALSMNGETKMYHSGDRIDVPAKTPHTAKMGPEGCTYVVGES